MKTVALIIVLALVHAASSLAAEPERFNNSVCPVLGNKIEPKKADQQAFVVYNNVRYELCCPACVKTFNEDPAKYLAKLPNNGNVVALGNTVCPVKEGAVDTNSYEVYNGTKVFFCCPACKREFTADPEKYIAKAKEELGKAKPVMPAQPQVPSDAKIHCPPSPPGEIKNPEP